MSRYIKLTKPKIILLLSLTGIIAYLIPSPNTAHCIDITIFLISGYFSAGGAMVVNSYFDRDIDSKMERTKFRASVGNDAINPPEKILLFGSVLSVVGILIGFFYFNVYTAIFLSWGVFYYIFGYTLILKRRTILNSLLGGFASAAPVWSGYAARLEEIVSENVLIGVSLEGWLIGLLVVIWTPSHTWSMSAKYIDDYQKIDIPYLPVKLGLQKTGLITMIFGFLTIMYLELVMFWLFTSTLAIIMLVPNLFLTIGLLLFWLKPTIENARICFIIHNIWLAIVFIILLLNNF